MAVNNKGLQGMVPTQRAPVEKKPTVPEKKPTVPEKEPYYWNTVEERFDGVTVRLTERVFGHLDSEVCWVVHLPTPGASRSADLHYLLLTQFPTRRHALKHVDATWPPPSWIEVPERWLHDLEKLAAVGREVKRDNEG